MKITQAKVDQERSLLPTSEEVYESALKEHPEFRDFDPQHVKSLAERTLATIATFERLARESIIISPKTAADIETIWIHSGTGNYDEPFKSSDNPRLQGVSWMAGQDRARLSRGVYLARRIAEVRSGQNIEMASFRSIGERKSATKEMIAEYGPTIFYSGYKTETDYVSKLVERPGGIIPAKKLHVLDTPLRVTSDAIRTFEYSSSDAAAKNVVIISHAPHLGARILNMIGHFEPLSEGTVPYVSPVATAERGRHDFALMETRGLLYYALIQGLAAEYPVAYQSLK